MFLILNILIIIFILSLFVLYLGNHFYYTFFKKYKKLMGSEKELYKKNEDGTSFKLIKKLGNAAEFRYYCNLILGKIINNFFLMIALVLFFYVLTFIAMTFNTEFINFPKSFVDFYQKNNTMVRDLYSLMVNLNVIFLSVSLTTVFTFLYRERKVMSSSSNLLPKNKLFIRSFIYIIANLLLIFVASKTNKYNIVSISDVSAAKLFYTSIIATLFSLLIFVSNLLKIYQITNINTILENTYNELNSVLFILFFLKKDKKIKIEAFDKLVIYIEAFYQLLIRTLEMKNFDIFEKYKKEWFDNLYNYRIGFHGRIEETIQSNVFGKLNFLSSNGYSRFYLALLYSHNELIKELIKTEKEYGVKEAIDILVEQIETTNDKDDDNDKKNQEYLMKIHCRLFYEMALQELERDGEKYIFFLQGIEIHRNLQKNRKENEILFFYYDLILRCVENEKIKFLSITVYSMFAINEDEKDSNEILKKIKINESEKEYEKNNKKAILTFLLYSLMKSIELSKYSSTGFLLKVILTNFNEPELIKNIIMEMFKANFNFAQHQVISSNGGKYNGDYYSPYLTLFKFNNKTTEYCFIKMVILLIIQSEYVRKNKIPFSQNNGSILDSYHLAKELNKEKERIRPFPVKYIDYIFNKLLNAKDHYGLLCLKDEEFVKRSKSYIYYIFCKF